MLFKKTLLKGKKTHFRPDWGQQDQLGGGSQGGEQAQGAGGEQGWNKIILVNKCKKL